MHPVYIAQHNQSLSYLPHSYGSLHHPQCIATAPRPFADLVSIGNRKAHTAVMKKQTDERNNGADTLMERRIPVSMGAMMPARRDAAEAMPQAVPRVETGNASGV